MINIVVLGIIHIVILSKLGLFFQKIESSASNYDIDNPTFQNGTK